ncbi:MAG TPA: DinB family protein [Thermomicrobiales bacterium]|nr:DinB family protein [Thermomicrobiales bacterium]
MTATTDELRDMTALVARIKHAYGAVEQAANGLSDEQLTAPGPDGGWSIKDHLAHLAVWRHSLIALLEGADRKAAIGLDQQPAGETANSDDIDDVNAILYQRNHDRAPADVQADFRQAQERVLAILGGMSDADLEKPYSHYQPDAENTSDDPVVGWIVGNTYGHDEEHLATIQALAGR